MSIVLFFTFSVLSVLNFSAYYNPMYRPLATKVFMVQVFFLIVVLASAIGFLLTPEPDSACRDIPECLSPVIGSTFIGLVAGLFTAGFLLLLTKDAMKRALKKAHPMWFIMGAIMAALALRIFARIIIN